MLLVVAASPFRLPGEPSNTVSMADDALSWAKRLPGVQATDCVPPTGSALVAQRVRTGEPPGPPLMRPAVPTMPQKRSVRVAQPAP